MREVPMQKGKWSLRGFSVHVAVWLLALCCVAALAGLGIFRQQARIYQQEAEKQLEAVARLKADEIGFWLAERHGDMEILSRHPLLAEPLRNWATSRDTERRKHLLEGLEMFIAAYGYQSITLLDVDDQPLLEAGGHYHSSPELLQTVQQARRTGKITMCNLHFMGGQNSPVSHLEFAAPVAGSNGMVLTMHADPEKKLFPLLAMWSGMSDSAETVLVREDAGHVLFLSPLHHTKQRGIRLPMSTHKVLSDALSSAKLSGIARETDYRGVSVIAAWRKVLGTGWVVVAKRDEAEVLTSLRRDGWVIWGSLAGVLCIASLIILYHNRRREMAQVLGLQAEQQTAQLRENEQRLRSIADSAHDAIILMDHQGRISLWNPAAERIFGYSAGEVIGQDLHQLIVPEEFRAAHYAAYPNFQKTGQGAAIGKTLELSAICKDGSRIPVELSLSSFQMDGNWHAAGILRDISERTQANQALRESEARFRAISAISADWIWEIDRQGRYTFASPGVYELLGYQPEEIIGRTPFDLMPPKEAERVGKIFSDIAQTYEPFFDLENITRHKNGTARVVLTSGVPILDGQGNPAGYRGIDRDVTTRKRLDKELEQHRAHLEEMVASRTAELELAKANTHLILDSSAAGIYGLDPECRVTFVNRAACEMLGYAAEEMIGKDAHPMIHHSHADGTPYPAAECPILVTAHDGKDRQVRGEVFWRKNGLPFPVSYATRAMLRDGRISGVVVSFNDITLEMAAESAKENLLQEAQRLARMRSEFLSNMSHEIRTPLNAILGFAQVGMRESEGRKSQKYYRHVLDSGSHLLGVINDILDFSKFEAGKITLDQGVINLAEIICHTSGLVEAQSREKGLAFNIILAENLPFTCRGDGLRVSQILANLLSNAVKFTQQGSVSLSAEYQDGTLLFRVADTGIGMSEEQQARLFQPFEQADGSITRRFGGSGLGLNISKQLVDLMGGQIAVKSTLDHGSTFEVRLPCVDPSWEPVTPAEEVVPVAGSGPRLANLSLLVAEDNDVNRLVLENMLAGEGCRLTQVENGRLAVERVQQGGRGAYDVVLMDVQMPEMDGYEATRRIHELAPDLPVIGLTAHALAEERQHCLDAGMVEHVVKPIDMDGLISAILRQAQPSGESNSVPGAAAKPAGGKSVNASADMEEEVLATFIDWPELEKRYSSQPEFMLRLLETILHAHSDKPAQLREAAGKEDYQKIAGITHSMKGMAGDILPARTREVAGEVEAAARRQQLETATMSLRLADMLEIQLDDMAAYVRGKTRQIPDTVDIELDWAKVAMILERLEPLLAADDTAANDLYSEIDDLLERALGENARRLGREIHGFDYQKALETVRALRSQLPGNKG